MLRLRNVLARRVLSRAIALLCLLAASMPMLLPFAHAARGSNAATTMQVLCTTHGVMWVVVDDGSGAPDEAQRYARSAACPLCAAGVHAFVATGPALPPAAFDGDLAHLAHAAPLTLSARQPWRLLLSSRGPPSLA